jgi:multiple antibiotic resistance protein
MTLLSATVLLFLVMDPLGNIPLFITALSRVEPHRRRKVILREMLTAFLILLGILLLGRPLFDVFGISLPSLNIAGGVILFIIAIKMIFASGESLMEATHDPEPRLVPLAVPLTAGPSTMSTLMVMVAREPNKTHLWLLALTMAWVVSSAILLSSDLFFRILKNNGLRAMEKLMGMILTAVATQMAINGLRDILVPAG